MVQHETQVTQAITEVLIAPVDYERELDLALSDEDLTAVEKAERIAGLAGSLDDSDVFFRDGEQRRVRDDVLPDLLGARRYRAYGRELLGALKGGPAGLDVLGDEELAPELAGLSTMLREAVVQRFVDGRLLRRRDGRDGTTTLDIGRVAHARSALESGHLDTSRFVRRMFNDEPVEITSLADAKRLYEDHNAERAIHEVHIQTDQPGARILPVNELRLGHQDGLPGVELVEAWAQRLQETPPEDRPGAILVTNLVQGDFTHSRAKKRGTLVDGLDNMANQFKTAQLLLEQLQASGVPVILSLGPDDHTLAHDYTLDVMAELRKFQKDGSGHIAYYDQNKLLQSRSFQQHKRFQTQYMLPLCYRIGRPLRSAERMAEETNGEITRSEYLMLYEHVVMGEPLDPAVGIDEELLNGLGSWHNNMIVVDDADIVFETATEGRRFRYRHTESLTPETVLQNHSDTVKKMLGNLGTNGYELPDATLYGRSQEAVYFTESGVPAVSLPGLTDPVQSLNASQRFSRVAGDPSLRAHTTRRRLWTPTMEEFEVADNGDVVLRFINKEFLDMADSLPRTAVFELCDIQNGSPTSRKDYLVKYLSLILETAEQMPIALAWAGDIIQGHIYPGFSDESQAVGLIQIQSQKLVIKEIMMKAFGDDSVPDALLDAVVDVLVQQGNHDEIQRKRVPNNNDPNIDYLIDVTKLLFDRPGEPSKVRHNAVFHTSTGTPVPTWMGTTHLGAHTIKTAHYHIERGMKGDGGGLPVYHPYQRAQGLGEDEKAHILMGAHWHNEQAAMIGRKLVVLGGAMAEQSQFEDMRGYKAKLAGSVLFLGGGQPPEVRFIHAKNLDRPVKYGFFRQDNLEAHGYHDDPGFDPAKHGPYSLEGTPKSALQKALLAIERQASQLAMYAAQIENPNTYDADGSPLYLNDATRRAFAQAALRAA